jgi:hypothetical protein
MGIISGISASIYYGHKEKIEAEITPALKKVHKLEDKIAKLGEELNTAITGRELAKDNPGHLKRYYSDLDKKLCNLQDELRRMKSKEGIREAADRQKRWGNIATAGVWVFFLSMLFLKVGIEGINAETSYISDPFFPHITYSFSLYAK